MIEDKPVISQTGNLKSVSSADSMELSLICWRRAVLMSCPIQKSLLTEGALYLRGHLSLSG